jgi:hypothetical protein
MRLSVVVVVGLVLGVLTRYAQGWLPSELGSLANSSGAWAMVAFGLAALLASAARDASAIGAITLCALLIGYVLGTSARGGTAGTALVLFWGAAALAAGPAVGIAGYWANTGDGARRAIAIGVISGILVGEGIYGLTVIADTTYTPYWWAELILGLLLVVWTVNKRPRRLHTTTIAVSFSALTAAAFVALYSLNLIAVLP